MPKLAVETDYEQKRTDVRSPEVCVDYLSYAFDEMDLAASWRVMTKQKKDIVNGIRLENASWRTWNKQRNHLKTVSPETLNWLKDSDVTWLYGPLHTVIKANDEPKEPITRPDDPLGLILSATSSVAAAKEERNSGASVGGVPADGLVPSPAVLPQASPARPLKSALKKVTMSDLLRRSASELQMDTLEDMVSLSEANRALGAFSPSVIATHRQPKLRFNQHVEQCVALSDDGQKTRRSRARLVAHDSSSGYSEESEEDPDHFSMTTPRSIRKIAPARLKSGRDSDSDTTASRRHPPLVRYDSSSSWEEDEDDARSVHLPHVFDTSCQASATASSAIQWEGQACVYASMPPSETEEDEEWDDSAEEDTVAPSSKGPAAANVPHGSLPTHPAALKSPATCEPSEVDNPTPQLTRASQTSADTLPPSRPTDTYQPSLFNNIAQWASSYLFRPTPTSTSSSSSSTMARQRRSM